jgi:nicotinamide mononucleotide adenylyltransferase
MIDFLSFLKEATGNKHGVLAVGRMNPPTTGHMQVINKVHTLAQKHNAEHKVVVTHSQDANKNPLSASQKVKHLKRYSGETNVVAGSNGAGDSAGGESADF